MTAWFMHEDIALANRALNGDNPAYSAMSWHCRFAGYGTFPPAERMQPVPPQVRAADPAATASLLEACARNFSA